MNSTVDGRSVIRYVSGKATIGRDEFEVWDMRMDTRVKRKMAATIHQVKPTRARAKPGSVPIEQGVRDGAVAWIMGSVMDVEKRRQLHPVDLVEIQSTIVIRGWALVSKDSSAGSLGMGTVVHRDNGVPWENGRVEVGKRVRMVTAVVGHGG